VGVIVGIFLVLVVLFFIIQSSNFRLTNSIIKNITVTGKNVLDFFRDIFIRKQVLPSPPQTYGIKREHPRIWLSDEVMQNIQKHKTLNTYEWQKFMREVGRSEAEGWRNALEMALAYQITKDPSYAEKAFNFLEQSYGESYSCVIDWGGSNKIIIFDWIYDYILQTKGQAEIDKWVKYLDGWGQKLFI
jgi:hypothetical protein